MRELFLKYVNKGHARITVIIYGYSVLILAATLKIAGDISVGNQFCPGSTAEFECQTTEGSLLWETSSTFLNHVFDNPTQPPRMLGIFLLSLDGISLLPNGTVSAVNSTAVVSNVQLSNNGTMLKCSENVDISMFGETVLRVSGKWCCACTYYYAIVHLILVHAGLQFFVMYIIRHALCRRD